MKLRKGKIHLTKDKIEIETLSLKNNLSLIVGILFLVSWFYFFSIVFWPFEHDLDLIMLYFLIAWLLSAITIIGFMFWGIFGKERLLIKKAQIKLTKTIFGFGIKREFSTNEILKVSFNKVKTNDFLARGNLAVWGLGKGKVQIDLAKKSHSFGLALEDNEAIQIVEILKERFSIKDKIK